MLAWGQKCEDFCKQKLQKWIYHKRAREYWSKKHKFTLQQFDIIDWNLVERVLSNKPQMYKLWFSKHHSGWCAHGRNMKRWKYWDKDKCPCCLTKEIDLPYFCM